MDKDVLLESNCLKDLDQIKIIEVVLWKKKK